jgi:hypothetical protein
VGRAIQPAAAFQAASFRYDVNCMRPGWYFELDGEEFDLKTMRETFREILEVREGKLCIRLDAPDAGAAKTSAHEIASLLNAAAHIAFDNHRDVTVGAGFYEKGNGEPATQIVLPAPVRSHRRVGGAGQLAIGAMFAAVKSPDFRRALWIFGSVPHDWRGLYVVLEVIESGCQGFERIANASVIKQINLFKRTANSFEALEESARHGPQGPTPPPNALSQDEAKTLCRTLLELWARKIVVEFSGDAGS